MTSWSWSFGDGTTSTARDPVHSYDVGGDYQVTLTVTDNEGATGSATESVTVPPPANQGPTAGFSFTRTGPSVTFHDESIDDDGAVLSWKWDFGDGSSSTERSPDHSYVAAGTYSVTLTVVDNYATRGEISKSVSVTGIDLSGKRRGRNTVLLDWTPSNATVDVWRALLGMELSPTRIAFGMEEGHYEDTDLGKKPKGLYMYFVCQTGSPANCSNEVLISF